MLKEYAVALVLSTAAPVAADTHRWHTGSNREPIESPGAHYLIPQIPRAHFDT